MTARNRDERGDTLVEILVAIIIIGIVASALLAAITTTSNATKSHRDLTTADAVLRNYAEATKQAVRTQCNNANIGSAFTVDYTPPTGVSVSAASGQLVCPATVAPVTITAAVANLNGKILKIYIRTPWSPS